MKRKKKFEIDKGNKIFKRRYMSCMITKTLNKEARRLSISPTEHDTWRELRHMVRSLIKQRYKTSPLEVLVQDMKENGAVNSLKITSSNPNGQNFIDNHDLCFRFGDSVSYSTKLWMEKVRKKNLALVTDKMCKIESMLWHFDVWAYHKVPFIVEGKIYFAALFIPETETIIEPYRSEITMEKSEYGEHVKRINDLKTVCKKIIILDGDPYTEERIKRELIPQCAKSVVLGPLGELMKVS